MISNPHIILSPATEEDLPALLDIINREIATGSARWEYTPWSLNEAHTWLAEKQRDSKPVIIAQYENAVAGYGTYGQFRQKIGYQFSMEHSVYVVPEKQGLGIGSAIMQWLIQSATDNGYHTLIAGIDAANEESIRFHARFGFEEVARLREVGFKFGRWLDLVFMQRMLNNKLNE